MMEHQYPGVDLPLRHFPGFDEDECYPMGAHENCRNEPSELLLIREVAMLILMDRLSDKAHWHEKVFNEEIVAKWRQEARTQDERPFLDAVIEGKEIQDWSDRLHMPREQRIISESAFDYVCQIPGLKLRGRLTKIVYFGVKVQGRILQAKCVLVHPRHWGYQGHQI